MLPSVIFVTASELTPESLIEKVLNAPLISSSQIDENITAYPWQIDNKYYTATVNLCAVANKCLGDEQFAASVNGLAIAFDANHTQGLEAVEGWLPFVSCYEAEVKMLVCTSCPEDSSLGVSKRSAQEWCIERGYELIELDPSEEIDPEDDFPETTGVERIRQALHAHQWPNLVMKDSRQSHRPELPNQNEEGEEEQEDLSGVSGALAESLEELLDNDSFGDLFSQLSEIKERVGMLSGQARQDAAEQVVRAFWSAIGGDQEDL